MRIRLHFEKNIIYWNILTVEKIVSDSFDDQNAAVCFNVYTWNAVDLIESEILAMSIKINTCSINKHKFSFFTSKLTDYLYKDSVISSHCLFGWFDFLFYSFLSLSFCSIRCKRTRMVLITIKCHFNKYALYDPCMATQCIYKNKKNST